MNEKKIPEEIKLPDFSKLNNVFPEKTKESGYLDFGRHESDSDGEAKMVWMNESAVVTADSKTPVVGTRSLADCLGIGVSEEEMHVAGADHMRFDPTHDPEGDNIGYAYGRVIHLIQRVFEKGGESVTLYLVNMSPVIRGDARNARLRKVIENAIKDERVANKIKKVEWIDHAEGFQIDSRTGKFRTF